MSSCKTYRGRLGFIKEVRDFTYTRYLQISMCPKSGNRVQFCIATSRCIILQTRVGNECRISGNQCRIEVLDSTKISESVTLTEIQIVKSRQYRFSMHFFMPNIAYPFIAHSLCMKEASILKSIEYVTSILAYDKTGGG